MLDVYKRQALDNAAALAAQVEALADKPEGFAVLDPAVEEPMNCLLYTSPGRMLALKLRLKALR